MQAFEFHTTAIDGIIRIPDEYVKQIGSEIRVVLYSDSKINNKQDNETSERSSLMDLAGVFRKCGNVDLEESRAERLKKYENLD